MCGRTDSDTNSNYSVKCRQVSAQLGKIWLDKLRRRALSVQAS
jgi:hypothetical protein